MLTEAQLTLEDVSKDDLVKEIRRLRVKVAGGHRWLAGQAQQRPSCWTLGVVDGKTAWLLTKSACHDCIERCKQAK